MLMVSSWCIHQLSGIHLGSLVVLSTAHHLSILDDREGQRHVGTMICSWTDFFYNLQALALFQNTGIYPYVFCFLYVITVIEHVYRYAMWVGVRACVVPGEQWMDLRTSFLAALKLQKILGTQTKKVAFVQWFYCGSIIVQLFFNLVWSIFAIVQLLLYPGSMMVEYYWVLLP